MKQVLFLILIVTLFSDLLALKCSSLQKAICRKNDIKTCGCTLKNFYPNYPTALIRSCDSPKRPLCLGSATAVNCYCVA